MSSMVFPLTDVGRISPSGVRASETRNHAEFLQNGVRLTGGRGALLCSHELLHEASRVYVSWHLVQLVPALVRMRELEPFLQVEVRDRGVLRWDPLKQRPPALDWARS